MSAPGAAVGGLFLSYMETICPSRGANCPHEWPEPVSHQQPVSSSAATAAASATSEDQARFIAAATQMLVRYHKTITPLSVLMGRGTAVGYDKRGVIVVPAPLDYVAWTDRVADFARRADLKAQERGIWLTGKISPRAWQEMTKLGWMLQDGGRLRPSQPSGR